MNEKLFLFKLLVHWILCQMLSDVTVVSTTSSGGIFNDLTTGTFSCCRDLSGSCKTSCESLSLVQLATSTSIKDNRIQNLRKFCPDIQVEFWSCMNRTLESIDRGSHWIGKSCCDQAILPKCEQGCAISASTTDLKSFCRQSDELTLFACIDQMERNTECCSNANSPDCRQICQQMLFEKNGTVHEMVEVLHKNCKANNVDVIDCVTDNVDTRTLTNSEDYVHCCRYGQSQECKDICKNNLNLQNYTEGEIIDSFIPSCGVVNLSSEFWTCFLNGKNHAKNAQNADDVSRIKQIGIDSAKLHCCEKAHSTPCRRQCYNEFSGDHSSPSGNFELDCLHNSNEMMMKRCIDEVDFPAEVGCDGLSFCSNFNNRPTELFRNCNPHADFAARNEFTMWKEQNVLSLPGFEFPINNISFCLSETWHAIACILQIKPTTVSQHFNQICWEDCFDILSKCMDWRRLENSKMEPAAICHRLSPDSKAPCISIKPYLEASDNPYRGNDLKIVSPCRGQQCNVTSEICEINRNINKPSCVQGCPMGEASNYLVPVGQYVRIPSSINKGCYKICKCMESGKIEKCQPVPCVTPKPCHMGNRTIDHGSSINIECNICSCYAEEITCTKKQCRIAGISERAFTSLPCNCPPHFVPVCARNGKTYPSACLAKCVGLQDADFEFGSCESRNPCDNHDCPQGTVCFPNRNVCLSNMSKPCPQYRCVSSSGENCPLEPLTDTSLAVHSSLCSLMRKNKKLAYFGVFDEHVCRSSGTACGINGVTYTSECEAMSDFSMVDYFGTCKAVGLIDTETKCSSVKCPRKLPEDCLGIIPTGACCPICGGALKIVYSRKQIDRGIYALKNSDLEALTLKSILKSLQQLIKVSSCYLSGFLTFETDIMIIVYTIDKNPNNDQIEVCQQEAIKIANLISTKSHHFTSNLGLSSFILANYIKPTFSSSTTLISSHPFSIICLSIIFLITYR